MADVPARAVPVGPDDAHDQTEDAAPQHGSPAELLRAAAAGRLEYAAGLAGMENRALVEQREALEFQARTLEQAARVVEGDLRPVRRRRKQGGAGMSPIELTSARKRAVWCVLMLDCGAPPLESDTFVQFNYHFPQCGEFRFQGYLGFGGKIYADGRRLRVSCYTEDVSPKRWGMIARCNSQLAALVDAWDLQAHWRDVPGSSA